MPPDISEGVGADATLASTDDAQPRTNYTPPHPERLHHAGAQTLMESVLPQPTWLVDGLLSTSCTAILASKPKAGKSRLSAQLGLAVSRGEPFLGQETTKAGVLYLSLEDKWTRLQNRFWGMTDEASDDFRLAIKAATLGTGLIEQLEDYLKERPDTKLIILDTLQIIRDPGSDYSYSNDYYDLVRLKDFADRHDVCLLIVHHLRKMVDEIDDFQNISGTTGITGAVDLMMVLSRDKRSADEAKLSVTGRDVADSQYRLRSEGLRWELVEHFTGDELVAQTVPECVKAIVRYVTEAGKSWKGTASELVALLGLDVASNALGKYLAQHRLWMAEQGIEYKQTRTRDARLISLTPADDREPNPESETTNKEES